MCKLGLSHTNLLMNKYSLVVIYKESEASSAMAQVQALCITNCINWPTLLTLLCLSSIKWT